MWEETKKIIKIRSLTPPTACESEWGPPRDHQEFDSSNEVRVTLLVDERDIIPQTRQQTRSLPSGDSRYDKSTVSPTAARARKALAIDLTVRDSFVDKEPAPRAIPTRIYARKSCARAYEYAPARSSTIGQLFPAAAIASKSRLPQSRGRPQGRGNRRFREPCRPKPVVARGPGRVDCRGRVPREHSASPRRHSRGQENQGKSARCRGAPHCAWFSVSREFVLSRQEETKTGVEHYNSPLPSRKTRRAHSRRWS